ncbi:hypothetical protein ACFVGY_21130, partial [Streptomyces sp. NPDC127106]
SSSAARCSFALRAVPAYPALKDGACAGIIRSSATRPAWALTRSRCSRWKELRGRLGPGRPRTLDLPDTEADRAERMDRHDWAYREVFRQHVHRDTLFLTGSARTFRRTAGLFADLARNGPARAAAFPDSRYRQRLHCGPRDQDLHIEYGAA